ncbi:MAG: site-specific DNA-methyltransferase [Acidilobaceae archaeon]|nr:site-specific DNA-methyltransferase [Acidilobaceae archaeon]
MNVRVIFGSSEDMRELPDKSVHLVLTSPPYFNAPFDFPGLFSSYEEYLSLLKRVGSEVARVLRPGRAACFVTQDVRIGGRLYPIVADIIKLMEDVGLRYQERIIWKKPDGYVRISRRSGALVRRPYPMYFYPDNVYEEILVFRKPGRFERSKVPPEVRERSRVELEAFQRGKWYLSVWEITNVLPSERWSKYTAVFPEELAERVVRLYSYAEELVLDPFLGTGTTCVVASRLGRKCVGYEVDLELMEAIRERLPGAELIERGDARRLRSKLREEIERRLRRTSSGASLS